MNMNNVRLFCFKQLQSDVTHILVLSKIIPVARLLLDAAWTLMLSSNNSLDFQAKFLLLSEGDVKHL